MTDYIVSAGQTLVGVTFSGGFVPYVGFRGGNYFEDSATVQSGGVLLNASDQMGATITVNSGGLAQGTGVSGGSVSVASGGTVTNTSVGSYDLDITTYTYKPYVTALDISGVANNTTINGGNVRIEVGGVANGIVVSEADTVASAYGTLRLPLDIVGSASALQVIGGYASVDGGSVNGATVSNGGTLEVAGYVSGLTAGAGSSIFLNSGILTGVSLAAGASLSVSGAGSILANPAQGSTSLISDLGSITSAGTITVGRAFDLYGSGGTLLVGKTGSLLNTGAISVAGGALGGPGAPVAGGAVVVQGAFINQGTLSVGGGGGMPQFEVNYTAPSGTLEIDSGASFLNQGLLVAGANGTTTPEVISVLAGAKFTNAGTLTVASSGGMSVAGTFMLAPGQVTTGSVQGITGSRLELASGTGTSAGMVNTYTGFSTVQVDAGANWTLASGALASDATVELGAGSTVTVGNGGLTGSATDTIDFQGASTLVVSQQAQIITFGITNFNTGSVINTGLSVGNVVFALASDDATVSLGVGYGPYGLRFLGDGGRHLQLRQGQNQTSTLTLEPVATAIVAHPDMSGNLAAGDVITFDLTSETALSIDTTTGLPTLALSNGGTAAYNQTASTSTNLVFRTTVGGGQSSSDLTVTGLSLGGASVVDAVGTTFDVSSVATLVGSNTGIVISNPTATPPTTPTPPATVAGGVTVIGGVNGTVFITPKAGSNNVTATAMGNDTIISQGSDTIKAGGGADVVYATGAAATVAGGTGSLTFEGAAGNDLVVGGSGSNAIYGGSGSDTFFGGTGPSILVAGSGANTLLLAGAGNATLLGGLGKAVVMFGGPGADSFTGSSGGNDIMVGGAGGNRFSLTGGDVAFGGPLKADSFTAGNGVGTIITGGGGAQVNLGSGALTSFEGSGAVNYNAGKGEGGTTDIVGFTVHDHVTLTGGFTAQDASTAFATATKGSFGTTLNLTDGTKITVFGINLTATQVSVG